MQPPNATPRRLIRSVLCGIVVIAALHAAAEPPSRDQAAAVFRALTKMSGTWRSKSTKGWTESVRFDVIARGSAVVESSHFEGEPNDGMMTIYFMDGDRLMATHYCEARNQPTLVARSISADGRHIEFGCDHVTNLATPEAGHMHDFVLDLVDDDHVKSRWSWFAKGAETWFEEIESVRVK